MTEIQLADPSKQRFYSLDGLRGIAAFTILVIHLGGIPAKFFGSGSLAVDFFFVLSGFVLAQAYGDARLSFAAFLRTRLIRLYPLYLVGTLMGIGAITLLDPDPQIYWAALWNIFFLPAPFEIARVIVPNGPLYPFDGAAWSLFYELFYNIVWFALLPALTNRRLAALCIVGAVMLVALAGWTETILVGPNWLSFWAGFCRPPYSFFAGIAAYRIWRARAVTLELPLWLIGLATLAIFAFPAHVLLHLLATLVLFPAIVLIGANSKVPASLEAFYASIGNLSYAIYILHIPIIGTLDFLARRMLAEQFFQGTAFSQHPSLLISPLAITTTIVIGFLLDKHFDTPVRRWLSKRR